jgi:hypothetical protein
LSGVSVRSPSYLYPAALFGRNNYIAMITAANTPHTITNALIIWFSSETDIVRSESD